MEAHFKLSDLQFTTQFAQGTLPGAWFTHTAHLRLAWVYINQYGMNQAMQKVGVEIRSFATQHGDPEKYHHTLTLASVQVIYHFMKKDVTNTSFQQLIDRFPVLTTSFKSLIMSHYSPEVIFNDQAKSHYVPPNLLAFDDFTGNQLDTKKTSC